MEPNAIIMGKITIAILKYKDLLEITILTYKVSVPEIILENWDKLINCIEEPRYN